MRFAGYAALFDRPDRGGDVVRAGAFSRSLKRGAKTVPLLWQHEQGRPIGRIDHLSEDKRGLRIIASLSASAAGQEVAALLKEGAVSGLSFGYRVRDARYPTDPGQTEAMRELVDIDLIEVSLVSLPMQPRARVHALSTSGTSSEKSFAAV